MKKRIPIMIAVIILIGVLSVGFIYLRPINLGIYKWDMNENIISYGDIRYKYSGILPQGLKLGKKLGAIEDNKFFSVWQIKGRKPEDCIVITEFMYPLVMYEKIETGEKLGHAEIYYKANKSKPEKDFKKITELIGYISHEELSTKGAKYILKKLMTYKEYCDLGINSAIYPDIDPDRMLWVFSSKFDKTHYIDGSPIEKATVTTVYDAETGDQISMTIKSDAPNGLAEFNKNHRSQ